MTDLEREFSGVLRERAMREVESRHITDEQLASMLDVFPDGARRLRHNSDWSVGTGLNVLEKMGVRVELKLDPS